MADSEKKPGRGRVYDSITETIGDTPLVRLALLPPIAGHQGDHPRQARILQSHRQREDRIGVAMVDPWEKPACCIPTPCWWSRPRAIPAIALAFVAAARGLRLILVMPESMSVERRKMLALLGAELVLTPRPARMKGAVGAGRGIAARTAARGQCPAVQEQGQPRRPSPHHGGRDLERHQGRGGRGGLRRRHRGTITGIGQVLKPRKASLRMVAVEPEDSPVLSGGQPARTRSRASARAFVPDVLDRSVIDGW